MAPRSSGAASCATPVERPGGKDRAGHEKKRRDQPSAVRSLCTTEIALKVALFLVQKRELARLSARGGGAFRRLNSHGKGLQF